MVGLWRLLRSPRLALGVLAFLAIYSGLAAWYPWQRVGSGRPPAWATVLGLDHPFTAPAFLIAVALLFLSTAACTWARTASVLALLRGARIREIGVALPHRPGRRVQQFLARNGFRKSPRPERLVRFRAAFAAGWILHVGLLALIAGVLTQQGCHDSGSFEVAEGERVRLNEPHIVLDRQRGLFSPSAPPALTIGLIAFDPFLHQRGYAPDRASRLRIERAGKPPVEATIDRAEGIGVGSLTIFQAIPMGLALVVEIPDAGIRAVHLRETTHTHFVASLVSPAGRPVELVLDSERHYDDPLGTGALTVEARDALGRRTLTIGSPFDFGDTPARLVGVARWGGFTYSLNPGMPAVLAGFCLVLLGAALLTLPAGLAELGNESAGEPAAWIYLARGAESLRDDWLSHPAEGEDTASDERSI